jgi:hypothetical protein
MSTYMLDAIKAAFLGVPLSGYGQGGAIKIPKKDETFDVQVGVDGAGIFWKRNGRVYIIEVTLSHVSPLNAVFTTIHKLDKDTTGGAGVGPFMLADLNGTYLFTSAEARIMSFPDVEFTNEPKDRVWKIGCVDGEQFGGGN